MGMRTSVRGGAAMRLVLFLGMLALASAGKGVLKASDRTFDSEVLDSGKNEVAFIEKHEGKSAEDIKAVAAEKADELKAVKAERAEAERAMKEKTKEWKKKEAALNKAQNILKQMVKNAA